MTEFRCAWCHRRQFDYAATIERGYLLIEIKCPKCGTGNSLRLHASEGPPSPATASATSAYPQQEAPRHGS